MLIVTEDSRVFDAYRKTGQASQQPAALVNPASGLANDYLNIFNEIVMLIEQLPVIPELVSDLLAWHPVSYQDYFNASPLPEKRSALVAFAALDETFRANFEAIVAELDAKAVGSVAAIRRLLKTTGEVDQDRLESLCAKAGENLRKTLAKATGLVNYGTKRPRETAQHRADRLLDIRKVG
jgi:hypothetical protein